MLSDTVTHSTDPLRTAEDETQIQAKMSGLQKCLVCYSNSVDEFATQFLKEPENKCFGNEGQLSEQMPVIFVVKNILQIPNSVCERFLRDLGNPSSWGLTYCSECIAIVKDAKSLAETIHNLQAKFLQLQYNIKTQISTSYDSSGRPPLRNFNKQLEALDEIRYVIANEDLYREEQLKPEDFGNDDDFSYDAYNDIDIDFPSSADDWEEKKINLKKGYSKKKNGYLPRKSTRIEIQTEKKAKSLEELKQRLKDMKSDIKYVIPPIIPLKSLNTPGDEQQESVNVHEFLTVSEHLSDQIVNKIEVSSEIEKEQNVMNQDAQNDPVDDGLPNLEPGNEIIVETDQRQETSETNPITIKPPTDEIFANVEETEEYVNENRLCIPDAALTEEERLLQAIMSAKPVMKKTSTGKRIRQRKPYTDEERPFKCTLCESKFATDLFLQAHIKGVHEGVEKKFVCPVENCTSAFDRRGRLERHMQSHLKRGGAVCSLCPQKFKTELRRDVHVQKIHYGISKCVACPMCDKKFVSVSKVELHLRRTHEMTVADDDTSHGANRTGVERPKSQKPLKCPKCPLRFDNEDSRYSHVQRRHNGVSHPFKCDICSKDFNQKSKLEIHKKYHEKKSLRPQYYPCEVSGCDKKYKKRFQLRLHVHDFHNDMRDFMCELCSAAYKSKKALSNHQAKKHFKELNLANFSCEECGKIFGSRHSLKKHIEMIHQGIYKHYCTICKKGCFSEVARIEHETLHTGKKLHNCEYCGKSFTWRDHFKQHLSIHTGEKKYHCDTCGQDFRDRTWFKRHQELHTGIIHNCHICGKGFPIRHNLGIHMKSHANQNGRNNREMLKAQQSLSDNCNSTSSKTKMKEKKTVTKKTPPKKKTATKVTRKRTPKKKQDSDYDYSEYGDSEEDEESTEDSRSSNDRGNNKRGNNNSGTYTCRLSSSSGSEPQPQISQNLTNSHPIPLSTPQHSTFGYLPQYQHL